MKIVASTHGGSVLRVALTLVVLVVLDRSHRLSKSAERPPVEPTAESAAESS